MTVFVTENCQGCRFTECINVCPVSCFHADEKMVYIDSSTCIECGACIPVCPVQAIYQADEDDVEMKQWIDLNRSRSVELPGVNARMDPLPGADEKRAQLGY